MNFRRGENWNCFYQLRKYFGIKIKMKPYELLDKSKCKIPDSKHLKAIMQGANEK